MGKSLDIITAQRPGPGLVADPRGAAHRRPAARSRSPGVDRTDLNPSVLFLASKTPVGPRWPPGSCATSRETDVDVFSGGSEPATQLNQAAVAAMAEKGVDISRELRSHGPTRSSGLLTSS